MKKVVIEKAPKKKVVIEGLPKAQGGLFVLGKDQKSGSIVGTDSSGNMTYMNPNAATPMQTFAANTKPEYQDPYFSENEPKQKTTPRFRFTGIDLAPISGNPYLQKGMNYLSRGINKIPGVMEYSKTGKISEDNLAPFYSGSMYTPFISEPETINKEVTPYYDERGKLRYKAEGGYNLPIAQNSMNSQLVGQEDDFDFSTQGLARPNLTVASNQYIADQNQEMSLNRPNLQGDLNQQLSASKKLDVPKLPGETARKAKRGFNQYTKGLVQASPAIDALAAGYQFGKGALDMMGSQMQNAAVQAGQAKQSQISMAETSPPPPYETQGYGFSGRNALAADGMQIRQIGGMGEPNVEVEGREHIKLPNGFSQEIQGKSHAQGGIPLNLPQGTQIFSEKLKDPQTKKSYADLAKKFETKKYVDLLNSKSADPIQKTTAEMMIKQNNAKLEELFALQEQNKLSGAHGADVQQKAMQEQQQAMAEEQAPMQEPMMAHGGYHLPKYQNAGLYRPSISGPTLPMQAGEAVDSYEESPTYKYVNDAKNVGEGAKRLIEQLKIQGYDITPEIETQIKKAKSFGDLNQYAPYLQKATWESQPKAVEHYGLNIAPTRKGLQYLLDKKLIKESDFPGLFRGGKAVIGSMKDMDPKQLQKLQSAIGNLPQDQKQKYAETNYKDDEWYYRNPEFKEFAFDTKEEYDKWAEANKQNQYGDYYFSGTEGLYLKPTYPAKPGEAKTEEKKDETTPPTPETITKYVRPEIGLDMAMGIPLPEVYGRDPLNYYKIEPTYIDPRYLDIQPQLNEITRGQRALQSNVGSRGSADMANLLQAQANAAAAQQQAFGQKYNYDRAQDAAAQQFNAQAKAQADQYNQQSWFQQLEDPIRRREGMMDTQRRTDAQQELENARKMQAFYGNKGFIGDTFYPLKNMTGEQLLSTLGPALLKQYNEQEEEKKKKEKSSENTTIKPNKYGGKVKIKPKLKGKFRK